MSLTAIAIEAANKFSQNSEQLGNPLQVVCGAAFIGLLEGWAAEQGQNYDYAMDWSRWFFGGAFALEEIMSISNGQYEVAAILAITFAAGVGAHHMPR